MSAVTESDPSPISLAPVPYEDNLAYLNDAMEYLKFLAMKRIAKRMDLGQFFPYENMEELVRFYNHF